LLPGLKPIPNRAPDKSAWSMNASSMYFVGAESLDSFQKIDDLVVGLAILRPGGELK